jgi:hypothetical protein
MVQKKWFLNLLEQKLWYLAKFVRNGDRKPFAIGDGKWWILEQFRLFMAEIY